MEAQNRLLQRAALFFPQLGVQAASMGLAGTDLAQHRDFARAAEAHRRVGSRSSTTTSLAIR